MLLYGCARVCPCLSLSVCCLCGQRSSNAGNNGLYRTTCPGGVVLWLEIATRALRCVAAIRFRTSFHLSSLRPSWGVLLVGNMLSLSCSFPLLDRRLHDDEDSHRRRQ